MNKYNCLYINLQGVISAYKNKLYERCSKFEVYVAYSVAKPTGMLEQKSRISNLDSLLTTTS
jgi:hypothetical protein